MSKPYISIIIPTLNSESTISGCLSSIFEQQFDDLEVIIVDGLSTDTTKDIVTAFQEIYSQNIKWCSEKDQGIYDAMNKGIRRSSGHWIYFLGSDDTFNNNRVLQEFYEADKTGYDVVYGNSKIIGRTGWAEDGDVYDGEYDLGKLLRKNICHQSIFYSRRCFKGSRLFNTEYPICSDWDFNLYCWSSKPFLYINLTVANFSSAGVSAYSPDINFLNSFERKVGEYFGALTFRNRNESKSALAKVSKKFSSPIQNRLLRLWKLMKTSIRKD